MKKAMAFLLLMAMTLTLVTGCGSKEGDKGAGDGGAKDKASEETQGGNGTDGTQGAQGADSAADSEEAAEKDPAAEGGKQYKIGVVQLTQHVALDAAYEGFVEGLKDAGYEEGKNITIDYQNAQGEQSNCVTIADKFVNDGVDLILAIATPAAQAAASKTADIPILVTAVTDPESSGLVESNDAPGGNVTGTSDLTPVDAQIKLLHDILPEAKNVGILYCSSEDNSEYQADLAVSSLKEMGMTGEKYTFSTLDEIQAVVDSMKGKVDAIYSPTDNKVAEGMATVSMIATEAGLPCIVGESGMVENGGLATYGLSYFNLGKLTGQQAASILSGESKPASMPIGYLKESDCEFSYNEDVAKELGITIDPSKFE